MKALARYLNALLGIWLIISAFAWPHTASQQTNAWVVGGLAAIFALAAFAREEARYLNTALAVWLFASIWILPGITVATAWNHGIAAIVLLLLSLVPTTPPPVARRPVERPLEPHATTP